jgi:hypothetical protein
MELTLVYNFLYSRNLTSFTQRRPQPLGHTLNVGFHFNWIDHFFCSLDIFMTLRNPKNGEKIPESGYSNLFSASGALAYLSVS